VKRVLCRSLLTRSLALIGLPMALMIVLGVLGAMAYSSHASRQALEVRAHLLVGVMAGSASQAMWNLDPDAARIGLSSLILEPDYLGSALYDQRGGLFVAHGRALDLPGPRPDQSAVQASTLLSHTTLDGQEIPLGRLVLGLSTARAEAESLRQAWTIAATGAALLLLACALLVLILRRITRPVVGMTRVMGELAAGRVAVAVPAVRGDDELGDMARALATLKEHAIERLHFIERQAHQMEEIERTVAERTRALQDALDSLHRATDELIRTEKMAALGRMVATLTHEINTPLGNSLTVASTLEQASIEFQQALAQREVRRTVVQAFAERVATGARLLGSNLGRATELMAGFKKVAVDQSSERRRRFDLAETVGEILAMLEPSLPAEGFQLRCDLPPGLKLNSCPGALSQVLTNLITNALVHGFDGREQGQILISARAAGPQTVILTVEDDGVGIAPEVLPRIFDLFFTTRLGQGGSGLGLHIVYANVTALLGGRIEVASTPGQGTRFTLTLPHDAPERAGGSGAG